MNSEYEIRLNEILNGPWTSKSIDAKKFLKNDKLSLDFKQNNIVNLNLRVPKKFKRKEKKISTVLAPHWRRKQFTDDESLIRDSFDEALTLLKILELAVRTNYLSVNSIKDIARKEIIELLWSKASRKYLIYYDYFEVIALAKRLKINLGIQEKLEVSKLRSNEINFGTFLSQLISIYQDEEIEDFLGFLDGYYEYEYENSVFYEFLEEGHKHDYSLEEIDRFYYLYSGLQKFVLQLSDFFKILTKNEKIYYGTFYAYWLAKFFGFTYRNYKFVLDSKNLFDWTKVSYINIFNRLELSFLNTNQEINENSKRTMYSAVQNLKKNWEIIKNYLNEK